MILNFKNFRNGDAPLFYIIIENYFLKRDLEHNLQGQEATFATTIEFYEGLLTKGKETRTSKRWGENKLKFTARATNSENNSE